MSKGLWCVRTAILWAASPVWKPSVMLDDALQALGLLVEVEGRRFGHRAAAVLHLVLRVLRSYEEAAAVDEEREQEQERAPGPGDAGDVAAAAQQDIVIARGWQQAYAALILFEKVGQQVSSTVQTPGYQTSCVCHMQAVCPRMRAAGVCSMKCSCFNEVMIAITEVCRAQIRRIRHCQETFV